MEALLPWIQIHTFIPKLCLGHVNAHKECSRKGGGAENHTKTHTRLASWPFRGYLFVVSEIVPLRDCVSWGKA